MPRGKPTPPGSTDAHKRYKRTCVGCSQIFRTKLMGAQRCPRCVREGDQDRPLQQRRDCLRCDRRFLSWGPENRLCQDCREFIDTTALGPNPNRVQLKGLKIG